MFSHPYSLANHVGNFPALSQCHRNYNIAHWASLELLPLLTLYFNVRAESQWFGELDFHSSFQKIFQSLIDLIIKVCFMIVWLNIHFRILFYNAYKFFEQFQHASSSQICAFQIFMCLVCASSAMLHLYRHYLFLLIFPHKSIFAVL